MSISDKLNTLIQTKEDIKNAIISKGITISPLDTFASFASKILQITTGVDTSDANSTSADILTGKTAYVNGNKITGTIPSKSASTITPSTVNQTIASGQYLSGTQTISGSANLLPANIKVGTDIFGKVGTFTNDANAIASNILTGKTAYVNGSKITGTIASKTAQTYTPSTTNQTIASGQYLSGVQTISGSANLLPANIKSGVNIFGKVGTLTSKKSVAGTINATVNSNADCTFSVTTLGFQPSQVIWYMDYRSTKGIYTSIGNTSTNVQSNTCGASDVTGIKNMDYSSSPTLLSNGFSHSFQYNTMVTTLKNGIKSRTVTIHYIAIE